MLEELYGVGMGIGIEKNREGRMGALNGPILRVLQHENTTIGEDHVKNKRKEG